MTRRIRRLLFCSAILFFIVATPSILFYAWGYSFDWQNKKPVLTGGLYLKSFPEETDVYLNNKLKKEETPAFIKRLLPKEYQVKITKQGFHPWQKKLRVESKLVTEARNILLIPLNPEIEIVNEKLLVDFSLKEFLAQEESDTIFYIQPLSYILYKTDQNGSYQEQISLAPLPANHQYQIFVSSNEKIAVLNKKRQLYFLNPETRSFELLEENVQEVQFANDNKKLLYSTPTEIWVYYLEDTFIQPNKKAGQKELITRLSQKIKQTIWLTQTNEHIIFMVSQTVKIIELDDRDYRNTHDLFNFEISQIAYSPTDKKLYFVKKDKLLRISLASE
ncbi:MAG: PEGA domain-containing protein [Candidatus Portnoybacteria bacterium]|nr:PEGA domain-containing protein [Candidatus Portnoybacteria bacterium]